MPHFVPLAHWQLVGWVFGILGLVFTFVTPGVNQWRVWHVEDRSVITSGLAWVGIWRACFYSHVTSSAESCRAFSIADSFVPVEIAVAQVLTMIAIFIGIAANITAGYALRFIYFGVDKGRIGHIKLAFSLAGFLYLLTATFSIVPLFWNMSSVLTNSSIAFPPEYYLPHAPAKQEVGAGIGIGIGASILLIISGLLFLSDRYPINTKNARTDTVGKEQGYLDDPGTGTALDIIAEAGEDEKYGGIDNPAFQASENLETENPDVL
ncbi:claudin-34 [Chanos chanos]|uniref:Claudin-34 n=1 Tax=Chanos chanos TaxID=29144 RepID=A0A6J2WU11_CHACN|nr:claudin-34-like [Chanos chanos]